jgi:hypothetical protein
MHRAVIVFAIINILIIFAFANRFLALEHEVEEMRDDMKVLNYNMFLLKGGRPFDEPLQLKTQQT